jgi:hypothetical protein
MNRCYYIHRLYLGGATRGKMTQQYFMNKGNNNFKEVNVKLVYRATSQCASSRERNIKKEQERERERKQRVSIWGGLLGAK